MKSDTIVILSCVWFDDVLLFFWCSGHDETKCHRNSAQCKNRHVQGVDEVGCGQMGPRGGDWTCEFHSERGQQSISGGVWTG